MGPSRHCSDRSGSGCLDPAEAMGSLSGVSTGLRPRHARHRCGSAADRCRAGQVQGDRVIDVLIIGALAVAALAFVAAPLRRPESPSTIDPTAELEERKNVALTAILDLENERDVGKL